MKKHSKLVSILIALVLVIGIVLFINRGSDPLDTASAFASDVTLQAVTYDNVGVDLSTSFIMKSIEEISLKSVENNLSVEPYVNYTLERGQDSGDVYIVPKEPLEPNQIYRFSLAVNDEDTYKWAFQTKGDFQVVSTLPRDKSNGVPLNTGIEISFSHLDFDKLDNHFEILPKVEGSFEVHKKTVVFIPKKLEPSTLYTVRIKSGLKISNSDTQLPQDYIFQFETQEANNNTQNQEFYLYKNTYEYSTTDIPVIGLGYYNRVNLKRPDIDVTIFKYKGAEQYINALKLKGEIPYWAYSSRRYYREDTTSLTKVANFSTPLVGDNESYLLFPEKLIQGFYLAELSIDDVSTQVWFQVTDLGVYAAETQDKTLVWVNDMIKGSPVQGAKVRAHDNQEMGITDKNGIAILTSPIENSESYYLTISLDNQEAVAAATSEYHTYGLWERDQRVRQQYWKYIYLDRGLYKPDDTIQFWGLIKPRKSDTKAPDKVTVELTKWGMWEEATSITSMDVLIKENIFKGSIKLPNLAPGNYSLLVKDGETTIVQGEFEVQTYTKPAYEIDVTSSKKALFVGEEVEFNISAAFFEGTGAANLQLNYNMAGNSGSVTTDNEGKASVVYNPKYERSYSQYQQQSIYLYANSPESGEIYTEKSVVVLNNDIIIEGNGEIIDDKGHLDVVVSKLTPDRYNNGEVEFWEEGALKGAAVANHKVKVKVYMDVWDKQEAGEYYDFINKMVQKRYNYIYRKEFISEGELVSDGNGKGIFEFAAQKDQLYRVELEAVDFRGNIAFTEVYVRGPHFFREYDYQWYHLKTDKENNRFKTHEEVLLTFMNNEIPLKDRINGYLFFEAREGLLNHSIQDNPNYKNIFKQELVPNYHVKGVYFDGRYYHESYEFLVAYDEQEKSINIDVTTDKEEYRPGEKVQLQVEVRDKGGKPIPATVNLNIVDEALYALRDQSVNILSSLYGDYISSGIRKTVFTHEMAKGGFGAEHGGEGGSERKDLRDAVFFDTITTDKNGKAMASFTLPDNLTSWRLTYQAVTNELQGVSASKNIKVKLPFFVDVVANDLYLTGDKPIITVRSFGDKLSAGDAVDFSLRLQRDNSTVFTADKSGTAFEKVDFPVSSLASGNYTLTVTGTTKEELSDTLTLPLTVKDTLREQQRTDFYLLDDQTKITGAKDYLTTITFADYERSQYLNILLSLSGVRGNRIDQKLAAAVANSLLEEYFPGVEVINEQEQENLINYQTPEGGLALLPYSGAELELSAKIAGLYENGYDRILLGEYFQRIVNDPKETRERGIVALYGLASIGEPVLQEINILLKQTDLNDREKTYLLLALIKLGDWQLSKELLEDLLAKSSEELGPLLRINTGKDQDDILQVTSLAAVAAAQLDFHEKNRLQQYVMENSTMDILTYIEQLLYLKATLSDMDNNPVSFSYSINGKENKTTLQLAETLTLVLSPGDLGTLKFSDVQGSVGAISAYLTQAEDTSVSEIDGVKITRSYSTADNTGNFKVNHLVKVSISYEFGDKALDGIYLITDYLPAGLKIIQKPHVWGINDVKMGYPVEVKGQKAVFAVYGKEKHVFSYYARVISGGDFTAEPAQIQHVKSGKVYHNTPKDRVTIQ